MKPFTVIFACLFGLLFFVYQQQAIALPASSVSYGQNPIVNIGGSAYDNETKILFSAPSNQDIIVTDIILTSFSGSVSCKTGHKSEFILSTGPILGQFQTETGYYNGSHVGSTGLSIKHSFQSGVVSQLELTTFFGTQTGNYGSGCSTNGVRYMIRYYAQYRGDTSFER